MKAGSMDQSELLADFQSKVDDVVKFQNFIDKATAKASSFTAKVVEKVVTDNTAKRDVVVEALLPLIEQVQSSVTLLESDKNGIVSGQEASRGELEELELRLAIEELTQDEFDAKAADLQEEVAQGNKEIGSIDDQLQTIQTELDRWIEVAANAGVADGLGHAPEPEPEPEPESEPDGEDAAFQTQLAGTDEAEEGLFGDFDIGGSDEDILVGSEPEPDLSGFEGSDGTEGIFTESVSISEDVSVVFGDDDSDDGLDLEVGDMDTLVDDDLVEMGDDSDAGDDSDDSEGGERHAVMLYQEGTAEEQIYPFSNDVLTLGRGRDNDIQVKNDSKVSRYHCKLYRRSGNFYIEDNKSANGTLVNGELITERRLFGGEEIIIGETFFRFRIMD
ncbi:MAG: hypothetical protein ACJAZO_001448 [Myxococcota bacterium]|jgi:hypothetical protein